MPRSVECAGRSVPGTGRVIVDDVLVAYWDESRWGARPESGRVSAELCGTVHGGSVPDDLPPVEGRVERVRVARQHYRRAGPGGREHWEPVPGTVTVADVRESPRWFAALPRPGEAIETGVFVDVHVAAASLPASGPST